MCVSRPRFVSSYSCPRAAADFDFNYSNFFDLHSVFSHGKFFFGRVFQTRYYYTVSGCFSLSLSLVLRRFTGPRGKTKKKKLSDTFKIFFFPPHFTRSQSTRIINNSRDSKTKQIIDYYFTRENRQRVKKA